MNKPKTISIQSYNFRIPADVQASIMCGSIKAKGKTAWDVVHQFYLTESINPIASPTRKQALLAALSCTKEKELLSR
jgi:hypothetical protein